MNKFSDVLRDLIIDSQLSLRQLANKSKVSASQYGKYLNGAIPTIDVAVRIANYFECPLDYLFGLTDKNNTCKFKTYNLALFVPRYEETLVKNNITHYKFAKANNLSESCLRHWKYGDKPKLESLIIIAQNLGVSIDYLIGRTDKK